MAGSRGTTSGGGVEKSARWLGKGIRPDGGDDWEGDAGEPSGRTEMLIVLETSAAAKLGAKVDVRK